MKTRFDERLTRIVGAMSPDVLSKVDRLWELAKAPENAAARRALDDEIRAIARAADAGPAKPQALASDWRINTPEKIREKLDRANALRQAGMRMHEISRELGVSDTTLYNWRKLFGGMRGDRVADVAALRDENRRLRRIISTLVLMSSRRDDLPADGS